MSLFIWAAFWMPALALGLTGLLLLGLGHWIVGPIFTLVGAFLMGAFWSFPREVWVARPCDLELDAEGFRVLGGYHAGLRVTWDALDAEACGVRNGDALLSQVLFAATRDGKQLPVAEGDEYGSFAAVLDAWRATAGLPPLEPGEARGKAKKRKEKREKGAPAPKKVSVNLVSCGRCGAAACPRDEATTPCLYCSEPVRMPEHLRQRLREAASHVALKAKSQKLLEQLLAQPRAPLTMALLGMLGSLMIAAWIFGYFVFARALLAGKLDVWLVLCALAAPLLITLTLSLLASVVAVRRVAVRAIAVEFAAIAPLEPGKPCGCRVCGAPLPVLERPVVECAYCRSFNVVSTARPRAPTRLQEQHQLLDDTLSGQAAEQVLRLIFLAVAGAPALWGAVGAVRVLWSRLA